jgi:hypothetical protein
MDKKELLEVLDLHFAQLRQIGDFVKSHPELTEPTSYILESITFPVLVERLEAVKAKSNEQTFNRFLSAIEAAVTELDKLRISLEVFGSPNKNQSKD